MQKIALGDGAKLNATVAGDGTDLVLMTSAVSPAVIVAMCRSQSKHWHVTHGSFLMRWVAYSRYCSVILPGALSPSS
jgi:hypothetical protein